MNTQIRIIAASAALVISATSALAESYQVELTGAYARTSLDGVDGTAKAYLAGAEIHFAPVRTAGHALAEAAFLERSSNIYGAFVHTRLSPIKADLLLGGLEVYVPRSPLYFIGEFSRIKSSGMSENDWMVGVGLTPLDGLRVRLRYSDDADVWALDGKYVFVADGYTFNLEAGAARGDDFKAYSVGGDFYIDRTWSVGGEWIYEDFDVGGSSRGYELRTRKFITTNLSLGLAFLKESDAKTWTGSVGFRF